MMLYLVSDREETRRHLLTNIKRLRESLDRLEGMVQSGTPHLNDLGELQQAPAAVEAGVGQFSVARRVLERYLKTYPAKGE
jgi:epoxyqueuosine reductase QueG